MDVLKEEAVLKEELLAKDFSEFISGIISGLRLHAKSLELKHEPVIANFKFDDSVEQGKLDGNYNGKYRFKDYYADYYFPHTDDPGVYIFFNDGGYAIYVGQSTNRMGDRIASHIKKSNGRRHTNFKDKDGKEIDSDYVITIHFNKCCAFLAPAFEYFLIKKYNPPANFAFAEK